MFFDKVLTKIFGTVERAGDQAAMPIVATINDAGSGHQSGLQTRSCGPRRWSSGRGLRRARRIDDAEALKAAEREALDEILPEAFAVVREAGWRAVQMRHFDVQLIGGMVLHQGKITEMKTGEGKTLVATLACYLNALAGHGVHVVTVNDYLAKRDAEWMGKIYEFLGLTVGVIVHDLDDNERRAAYACRHYLRDE